MKLIEVLSMNDIGEIMWTILTMRRKQAEFLVKNFVPADCIEQIAVYDEIARVTAQEIVDASGFEIAVKVNPGRNYYY